MSLTSFSRVSQINNRIPAVWDLRVFLLRVCVWCSSTSESPISMILCDEDGVRIEAFVASEDYEQFKYVTWFEGRWFRIREPRVLFVPNGGSLTPHPYKLRFDSHTVFARIHSDLPLGHYMVFSSLNDIFDGVVDELYPKDVLGVVTKVEKVKFGEDGPKLQFTLRDIGLRSIQCLLSGKDVFDLIKAFRKDADHHVFVILRCFYVKRSSGYTWLKGLDGLSTIKYEQFEIPEWNDMRNRFPNPVPRRYPRENDMSWFIY